MKIQFERQDSFYKIIKTIEKIPDHRKVIFVIHSDNNMFANDRWWKQFRELCESKQLQYTIRTWSAKIKQYCDRVGIPSEYHSHSSLKTIISIVYSFFFKIRDFHFYVIHQRKYIKYIIFVIEAILILLLWFYVYGMLVPQATITITPSYDIEDVSYNFRFVPANIWLSWDSSHIAIPYYQTTLPYQRILRTSIQSIRYSAQTAKWTIRITNTTPREYALRPYTRLITEDGLIFRTTNWINLAPWWEVIVDVAAEDVDEFGQIIGSRGNIASWTLLLIRNLNESRTRRLITAVALNDFGGWDTLARGVVTQQDIDAFEELARTTISQSANQIIRDAVKDQDIVPLFFSGMIASEIRAVDVDAVIGDPLLEFDGEVSAVITYNYIKWSDVQNAINQYFAERSSDSLRLVNIQKESFSLFNPVLISTGIYSIPTTVSTLWSYNFDTDIAGFLSQIRDAIAWMSKESAQQLMLSYPDISVAKISISPFWYQSIPTIRSRVIFSIIEPSTMQPSSVE